MNKRTLGAVVALGLLVIIAKLAAGIRGPGIIEDTKGDPDAPFSNVIRLRERDTGQPMPSLVVADSRGRLIEHCFANEITKQVMEAKPGGRVLISPREVLNMEVIVVVEGTTISGYVKDFVPVVAYDIPSRVRRDAKLVALRALGMANAVMIQDAPNSGVGSAYVCVIFDDTGYLLATHCLKVLRDGRHVLCPTSVTAPGEQMSARVPQEITVLVSPYPVDYRVSPWAE